MTVVLVDVIASIIEDGFCRGDQWRDFSEKVEGYNDWEEYFMVTYGNFRLVGNRYEELIPWERETSASVYEVLGAVHRFNEDIEGLGICGWVDWLDEMGGVVGCERAFRFTARMLIWEVVNVMEELDESEFTDPAFTGKIEPQWTWSFPYFYAAVA